MRPAAIMDASKFRRSLGDLLRRGPEPRHAAAILSPVRAYLALGTERKACRLRTEATLHDSTRRSVSGATCHCAAFTSASVYRFTPFAHHDHAVDRPRDHISQLQSGQRTFTIPSLCPRLPPPVTCPQSKSLASVHQSVVTESRPASQQYIFRIANRLISWCLEKGSWEGIANTFRLWWVWGSRIIAWYDQSDPPRVIIRERWFLCTTCIGEYRPLMQVWRNQTPVPAPRI
jgi:hypothetical protein